MLLIDGVKYELWTPQDEVKEFQPIVKEHSKEIFGESSEYFDIRQKLETRLGKISIPEGFVVDFGKSPCWHIIEVELSKHDEYYHIGDQVNRFMNGIKNSESKKNIVDATCEDLKKDDVRKSRVKKSIEPYELYEFLTMVIFKPPTVTIIVEDNKNKIEEALENFTRADVSDIKVVEFQTFVRKGCDLSVHAHLFEPLHVMIDSTQSPRGQVSAPPLQAQGKRVTVLDLINAGIISLGQRLSKNYKGKLYVAEIIAEGQIKLLHDKTTWKSLSSASGYITGMSSDGWVWWKTQINGTEYVMDDLRRRMQN